MEIKEIQNKEIWENFLSECQEKTFLQSWNWGEFNKMTGNKIWRLGIYNGGELISAAFLIKVPARRGVFISCPHGPVIKQEAGNKKEEILKMLLEKVREIAKEEKATFFRLSPIEIKNEENIKMFKKLGLRNSPIFLHPDLTWELDITPSEDEILSQMRKTTRYLIRQAQKNQEIEIVQTRNINDIDFFDKLYKETVGRQHFVPYSLDFLKSEFSVFDSDNQIAVFLGKYQNEIIVSALIVFWQDLAVYHHGATSFKYSKIPASYLVQWEVMKEAKRRGCKRYNFWGIAPEDKPNHPWQGFTLFKKGFGGYKKEFITTQDFPFSKKYWLTFVFEKLRKTKRGL